MVQPKSWTWREIAAWLDTEGSIAIDRSRRAISVRIAQNERDILESMRVFLALDHIRSSVGKTLYKGRLRYFLQTSGMRNVGKYLQRVTPFLRTRKMMKRASEAMEFVRLPFGRRMVPLGHSVIPFEPRNRRTHQSN